MSSDILPSRELLKSLNQTLRGALELLGEPTVTGKGLTASSQQLGSLMEQCLALCAERESIRREPIRLLHHFACTGGTLISKCVAAMPNVQLFSEIEPFSTHQETTKPRFAPTDLITQARQSTRGAEQPLITELFASNLEILYQHAMRKGYRLVLRDHAHSRYCNGADISSAPSLAALVSARHEVLSVLTVRKPVESYLSMASHGWHKHFTPASFDEYCRRYLVFVHDHAGADIYRYEDLLDRPTDTMQKICGSLDLPFVEYFDQLFGVFQLTGDSGRSADVIGTRKDREISEAFSAEIAASENHARLKDLLGYD